MGSEDPGARFTRENTSIGADEAETEIGSSSAVDFYDRHAERFHGRYEQSAAFRERNALWREWIADFARSDDEAIDVGSGSGVFSLITAEHVRHVTGYDGSAAMVALSRQRARDLHVANVEFHELMIEALARVVDKRFGFVLCSSVLEYLDDPKAMLVAIRTLMAPGATFLVSMPNGDSRYRQLERFIYRMIGRPAYYRSVKTMADASATRRLFREAGFRIVRETTFGKPPAEEVFRLLRLPAERVKTMRLYALCRDGA